MPLPNGDSPKEEFAFRQFGGMYRRGPRTAMPTSKWWYASNLQPIADGNFRTAAAATLIASLTGASNTVFATQAWSGVVNNVPYLFIQTGQGLYALNLNSNTLTLISASNLVVSDAAEWNNTNMLFVGPTGYFSWNGSGTVTQITPSQYQTLTLDGTATNFNPGDSVTNSQSNPTTGTVISFDTTTRQLAVGNVAGPGFVVGQTLTDSTTTASGVINAVDVPGVPDNGQAIAVYAGRVWIAQGRAITFSGPNDYSAASWSVALGSGTALIADETLTGNLVRLIPSAGYLYVIGPSSVDVISNVYVPAGETPPTPLFNRQNISSTVGTPYPMAAFGFDRNIGIVNQYGIYVVSGVQTQRISQEIDDIITSLEWNAPLAQVSCSVAVSNEIPVLNFLVSWHDPDAPTTLRQTILCWSDGKWWLYDPFGLSGISAGVIAAIAPAFQGNTLRTYIIANTASGSNSVMSVYVAYDGTSTALVPVVLKSALTDFGSSIWTKQALKLGIEGNVQDANSLITATCDNEIVTGIAQTYLPKVFKWVNGSGLPFTWYNAAGQLFTWVVGGYAYAMKDVQTYGRYLGLSLSGTMRNSTLTGMYLEFQRRARW